MFQLSNQSLSFFNSKLEPFRKINLYFQKHHLKTVSIGQDGRTCTISDNLNSKEDDDNLSVCSSIYLDFDADLNEEYSFIGVLITIKKGDQQISASTAFLINDRTLVTCIHAF